jgi:hypothetical protein
MFKRPVVSPESAQSTSLSPNLQQLHGLNLDFLLVLQSIQQAPQRSSYHGLCLADPIAKLLLACDHSGMQRMASCDVSLFSLQWHRVDEWTRLAEHSALSRTQPLSQQSSDIASDSTTQSVLNFIQCAVFFGWHLAQHDEQAARFMLGMSPETATVMRTLDLWQCRYIGQHYQKLLAPRWLHNRYFWTDLLQYGRSGNPDHLKLVQLLGTQLMAQDLEPSAIARHSVADDD